jgi:hypothetical protein
MTPDNVKTYAFISGACFSDMTQGYENRRGENCFSANPEVKIRFKEPNLAYVSKVEIQRESAQNPGNIRQIEAVFYNANDSAIVDEVSGDPVRWRSPENEPIINGYFKDVRGLNFKVLRTDNNGTIQRLRVKITGCYTAGMIIT